MSWKIVSLGEVCKVIAGQSPKGTSINKEGKGLPFYQGKKDFGDVYINPPTAWTTKITKEAIKDDILISVRAPVGPVNIATGQICIGRGLAAIRTSDKINKSYLFKYLLMIQKDLVGNAGAVFNSINKKQIESLKIPLPPLPIQQKIVAKLDKIFAETDNLDSSLQNKLIQIKMMNNILISSLIKKEKNLKKVNLKNICNIKGRIGYRGYTKKDITTKGLGAISLGPSNIVDSKLNFKKTTYVSWKKYEESPEIMINPGDIIFCKTASIGKTAYIEYLPEKATLNPQLVVFKNIKCNKKYLFYYMMTENFKYQIEEIVGGTAIPTLSQEKLGETLIELPSEISQKIIVNKIDQCNKNIEQIFNNTKIIINNIHSLKEKVLQEQLTG